MVEEDIMPIIGFDAISYYKANFDWDLNKITFVCPWDQKVVTASRGEMYKINTIEKVTIPSGHGMYIPSEIQDWKSHDEELEEYDWLIEPHHYTTGTIHTVTALERGDADNPSRIITTIWNCDHEDVTIDAGTHIGNAMTMYDDVPYEEVEGEMNFVQHISNDNIPSGDFAEYVEEERARLEKEKLENIKISPHLNRSEFKKVQDFLKKNEQVFSVDPSKPPTIKGKEFHINTGDAEPIKQSANQRLDLVCSATSLSQCI